MRAIKSSVVIILLLFGVTYYMHAQSSSSNLNQVELMRQFIGTWEGELGEDTLYQGKNEAFGSGIIGSFEVIANEETTGSVKQLIGYDKELDKYIVSELIEASPVIEICHLWFISEHIGKIVVVNPQGMPFHWTFEFKTPDTLLQTAFQGEEVYKKVLLYRVNKQ